MKVITLMIEKGGVGKTTLSLNLAAGLAMKRNANGQPNRVLIIDTDPQDGSATLSVGLPRGRGTYNLMVAPDEPEGQWERVLTRVPESFTGYGGLNLFITRSNLEVANIPNAVADDLVLHNRLSQVDEVFDYVIIDTSPAPGMLIQIIAAATTHFIVPTQCEVASANDALPGTLSRIVNAIRKYSTDENQAKLVGIVPNQKKGTSLHRDVEAALKEQYGAIVFDAILARTAIAESAALRQSIFAYQPNGDESDMMWRFIERVEQEVMAYG